MSPIWLIGFKGGACIFCPGALASLYSKNRGRYTHQKWSCVQRGRYDSEGADERETRR